VGLIRDDGDALAEAIAHFEQAPRSPSFARHVTRTQRLGLAHGLRAGGGGLVVQGLTNREAAERLFASRTR
jgi:hypothetical protein